MTGSLFGFDAVLGFVLVAVALGALLSRDLFQATVMFIVFGLLMSIAWCRVEAFDVALAEAAIGAGLTGALFLNTLAATRHLDRAAGPSEPQDMGIRVVWPSAQSQRRTGLALVAMAAVFATALAAVVVPLTVSSSTPPTVSARSLAASGVSNPVTAVLLNFRAYDTLLEVAVLLAAIWAILPVSATGAPHKSAPLGAVLRTFMRLIMPLAVLTATYVLWIGTKAPGGAFQAAAMLTAVTVLWQLAGAPPPSSARRRWRVLLVAGFVVFLLVALSGMLADRRFLEYRLEWAGVSIMVVEVALTISIALILTMLFSCISPGGSGNASKESVS